jgi:hypothetical protein
MSKLYVRLRASNEEVITGYSTTNATVTYPVTPTLSIGSRGPLEPIVLSWNAPYAQFTSLEYSEGDFSTITIQELTAETYTITTPGIYNIRVRASYNGSFTEYSNLIQAVVFPTPLLSIKPRNTYNDLEVVWSSTPGFTYTVQYSLDSTFTNPIILKTAAPGTYYLKIKVKYGGLETESLPVSAILTAIPAAPTLSVSQISEYDSVAIEWTSTGPDFNTYSVEYATDIGFTQPTVTKVTGTRYDVILPTNVYYFRVRALYETDVTAYSYTITQNVLYRTKPDAPTLSTNRNDYEQVQLTWIAPTDTLFNQYVVEYANDALFTDAIVNTVTTNMYQPTISPGMYYFRMRVKHQSLNVYTAYRSINAIVLPIPDAPLLAIIQENEYSTNLTLAWTEHPLFNQYVLEYSLSPAFTNAERVMSARNVFALLTERLPSGLYYFRVKAYYGTANTAFATVSTNIKKIPFAPDIRIINRSNYQPVTLYWSPDAVFNQYFVEYATDALFTNAVVTPLTTTTYQPTLSPGMYFFRIRAKHQSLDIYTAYSTTSATLSPLPRNINVYVAQRLPNEPIVLTWNGGAVNYSVITTGVNITTQNNTYTISNSTFGLPMLYVIEVTAYYGLGNTLPVMVPITAFAQEYYPLELRLTAITTPDTYTDTFPRIIIPGSTSLSWNSKDTPNDATYDLYKDEVLSNSNVSIPWHVSSIGVSYRVRLRSIYGNLTSNIVFA